ncbi:MAG: DNA repair protein RecO [Coriobacteriales bacterium]|jgi:DNA repair protein RecO (recombination protein O)|nr:DNA repair protein RecO [Coriobacteriales bacterium]
MPDYSTTILVLKKTKLGETDLIITGFTDEGRQVRAVAKGARRPGSRLGVHLELYSETRVLLHRGRNLDIVTEASRLCGNEACRADVLHSAGAAVIVELLDKVSADGDTEARLFFLSREALRCIGAVPAEGVALIAAATILKVAAQLGFRPSLSECVCCGAPLGKGAGEEVAFSFAQGGVLCAECLLEVAQEGYRTIDAAIIDWARILLASRFSELEGYATAKYQELGNTLLTFAREWLRHHLVGRLKSLDFLLSMG